MIRRRSPAPLRRSRAGCRRGKPLDGRGLDCRTYFSSPLALSIAFDNDGNYFVAERDGARVRKIAPDGTITTVVGNGSAAYSGDGGPANAAQVISPYDLAFDHAGNLLIADFGGAAIRIVHPDGTIGTLAGNGRPGFSGDGGPAASATLNSPSALAIGPDGSVFIADGGNHRIRRITPDGMISTYAGNGKAGYSGDGGPAISASLLALTYSLAVDSTGNLYIADRDGNAVREVTSDGYIATIAGKAP